MRKIQRRGYPAQAPPCGRAAEGRRSIFEAIMNKTIAPEKSLLQPENHPAPKLSILARARWIGRILVACRVSVISALAGVLLFALVPQARDLFADISFGSLPGSPRAWIHWLLFFIFLVLIWAFPVHYAARRMLETNDWMFSRLLRDLTDKTDLEKRENDIKDQLGFWIDWIPRALGVVPFIAVLIGLWKTYGVVGHAQALQPAADAQTQIFTLGVIDLVVMGLFVWFLVKRREKIQKLNESHLTGWLAFRNKAPSFVRKFIPEDVFEAAAVVSFVVVTAIFVLSYFYPFGLVAVAPRAVIVPFLFGSLVLSLTLLAWASDRSGFPLLALSVVAAFVVTAFNSHFNDLRKIENAPQNLAARQIEIDAAIIKWKAANNCENGPCPPALIVAAEGGASRAAFATATALGELFDRADELPDKNAIAPARRLFAISGVSGGSFGAATIRTALWEALDRGQPTPPCKNPPPGWFAAKRGVTESWRPCLQALVAGDYLTPAFVGLAFRDNFSPPKYLFSGPTLLKDDRAALVEKAWEDHFDRVVDSKPGQEGGLRRPFGYVSETLDKDGAWLPLLLLNGTSVDSGTRILVSDIVSTRKASLSDKNSVGRRSLYPAAFDLFEMLSTPCPPKRVVDESCIDAHDGELDTATRRDGADVRLSTAAMLSARFPIVSPAGTIRATNDGGTGDRVVDGGYFENAGLTTALDLARALKEGGVTPVVLWVQNDPSSGEGDPADPGRKADFPPRSAGTPQLNKADPEGLRAFAGPIATPFDALAETRTGHALEEATYAQRALEEMNIGTAPKDSTEIGASYFTFKMFKHPRYSADAECAALARSAKDHPPEMSEVSMSWWMSQAVQAEVDSQICDVRNRQSIDDLMKRLSQRLSGAKTVE
jgi:hypothetical protein